MKIEPRPGGKDIEAWQPVESPSAVRHVDELMSSRSEPNGLQVERLARELTRKGYRLTKKSGFTKDYGLKRQIQKTFQVHSSGVQG